MRALCFRGGVSHSEFFLADVISPLGRQRSAFYSNLPHAEAGMHEDGELDILPYKRGGMALGDGERRVVF